MTLDLKLPASPAIRNEEGQLSKAEEIVYWVFRQRFFKKLQKLVPQISQFARQNHVSHILSVIDHPATICITKPLASSLNIPYSTFSSTIPETVLHEQGYDARSKTQVLCTYNETLKTAYSAGFASLPMSEHYKSICSANPMVLSAPVKIMDISDQEKKLHQSDTLNIGCILNPRHMKAIHSMIAACQDANWKIANQNISLTLIGSAVRVPFNFGGRPASIEIMGGLSYEESVMALADCAVNFLPSWSEKQFAQAAQLCYPDELLLYVEAKKPILALSVKPSLIDDTMRAFSLGETIETCSENSFIQAIERLATEGQNMNIAEGFQRLEQERFSERLFRAGLATFLTDLPIVKNSNV